MIFCIESNEMKNHLAMYNMFKVRLSNWKQRDTRLIAHTCASQRAIIRQLVPYFVRKYIRGTSTSQCYSNASSSLTPFLSKLSFTYLRK